MANWNTRSFLYLVCVWYTLPSATGLPTVDPGVFVLQGVPTCREGKGYCLLGRSCLVDRDFAPDEMGGHCHGVTQTFTTASKLAFVCCKYVNDSWEAEEYVTTLSSVTVPDDKFQLLDQNPIPIIDPNNTTVPENTSGLIEIIGVVTDTTGILDLITRPYQPSTTANTTIVVPSPLTTFTVPTITSALESGGTDFTTPAATISTPHNNENVIGETTRPESPEEHPYDDEFQIINLPKEVQKYLEQRLKDSTSQNATLTPWYTTTIEPNDSTTFRPLTKPNLKSVSNAIDTLKDRKLIEDFLLKTSTYATHEIHRKNSQLNLIQNPIVPLKVLENQHLSGRSPTLFPSTTKMIESTTEPTLLTTVDPLSAEEFVGNAVHDVILPHPINRNSCGKRRSNLRGSDYVKPASTYDWCWSAALMTKQSGLDRFECSGTLVELDLVVTTAACIKRLRLNDLPSYRIVLGDSNLRDELPYGVQYHDIVEMVTHPDYMTFGGIHANDIGIIRLRSKATLDHNVCLACLSQARANLSSESCVVSGYMTRNIPRSIRTGGRMEDSFLVEGVLRESKITIENPSSCQSSIENMVPNPLLAAYPEAFICDSKEMSAKSCDTTLDAGSPLVCKDGGRWYLTGISSWGSECTSDPQIYTRVNAYSEWFLNNRLRMNTVRLAQQYLTHGYYP